MNIEELNKELFQQLIALGSSDGEQLKEEISAIRILVCLPEKLC